MKKPLALCAFALAAAAAHGAPTAADAGTDITALLSTKNYTMFGGLMQEGDTLYLGNFNQVQAYNLQTGTASKYASIRSNADTKALGSIGGSIYMALDTSYYSPYPSILGTVTPSGFSPVLTSDTGGISYSIFDAAVYDGSYYFTADLGDSGTLTGSRIFRFDPSAPTRPVEIANIGGLSGGLTFDSAGNLYYASQNAGQGILRFDAADVLNGGLSAADGVTVVDITATNIAFFSTGELVAETLYGQSLGAYSLASGNKLYDIASTSGYEYMGKFIVGEDDMLYLISSYTDYSSAAPSTLYAIALQAAPAVPEPSPMLMLVFGMATLLFYRRRYC